MPCPYSLARILICLDFKCCTIKINDYSVDDVHPNLGIRPVIRKLFENNRSP